MFVDYFNAQEHDPNNVYSAQQENVYVDGNTVTPFIQFQTGNSV